MAQRGIPDRKAMFVKVYPEYESSARQTQHDHRGFDIVTGYDPGHQGVADPLPSPTPLVTSSRSVNRRDYKPTALRWWFHLLLIVCLGAFIGMTEYAIRNLANYHDDAIAKILASRGGVDDMFAKVAAVVVDSHSHPELARADGAQNSSGPTDQPVTPTATSAPAGESTTVDGGAGLATATTIDPPVTSTTDNGAGVQTKTTIDGGAGVVTTSTTTRVGTIPDPNAGLQDKTTTTTEPPALTTTDSGAGVETLTTTDDKAGVGTGTTVTPAMSTDGGLRTVTTLYPSTTDGEAGLVTETTPDGSAGLKTQTTAADGGRTTTSVTVIQQTTTLPSSEVTIERTTTAADGRPTIETVRTTVPGQTSVVQQSITVAPGEVLTTMTTVYAVTLGGTTETHATTWTDSDGSQHSSSYTTVVGGTTSSTTLSSVVATAAAPTGGSGGTRAGVEVLSLSETEYLAGAFLATILAVLVAFPLNLISINAKLMQPFHVLATSSAVRGATAEASVFLRFYSWSGALSLPRALRRGQPVIVLSDLLVGLAALLSPVAATTMSIHVGDGCQSHCFGRLGVSVAPARALQALMAAMVLLLALLLLTVSVLGWRTGVGQNPWGIAGMAGLCRDAELRERLQRIPRGLGGGPVDEDRVLKVLGERRYALGRSWEPHESSSSPAVYGVMVAGAGEAGSQLLRPNDSSGQYQEAEPPGSKFKKCQPFAVLTWWGRGGLFVLFSSVLIIVTYYGNTGIDSGFERFMDSQSLGVKFLFTALGVALGFSMNNFFRCEYRPRFRLNSWLTITTDTSCVTTTK